MAVRWDALVLMLNPFLDLRALGFELLNLFEFRFVGISQYGDAFAIFVRLQNVLVFATARETFLASLATHGRFLTIVDQVILKLLK